jgi:hypothetical protein
VKETRYEAGTRHYNGKFVGWAVWKVHVNCTKPCCPKTVAEFYGKYAKSYAVEHRNLLNKNK